MQEIIDLRKKLLKNVKDELKDRLGKETPDIKRYYNEYRREFKKGYKRISSKKELIKKLLSQNIILCGDYHTLKQAQNTAYKIILELLQKREIVLCLELINDRKQEFLNQYIRGEIDETVFLKNIKYTETWGFNWKNYRPILKLAMENRIPVYGINCAPNPLSYRDKIAAQHIFSISKKHSNAIIFVLFGDLHIATPHLPKQLKLICKENDSKKRIFQIFQNSEPIYWQLLEKENRCNVDVVELKPRSYCIQNTPPWVKLQSFLIWAEHGEEILNSNTTLLEGKTQNTDYDDLYDDSYSRTDLVKEQFYYILDILYKFFAISNETLEDPQIISIDDLYISKELKDDPEISQERYNEIVDQILIRKSYYIPEKNIIFLTSYSLNHAAHAATIYLFSRLQKNTVEPIKRTDGGNSFQHIRENFYKRVLTDAIGFLGSKIINPKRKCFTYSDHQEYYETHKFSRIPSMVRKKKIAYNTIKHHQMDTQYQNGKITALTQKSIYIEDPKNSYGISKTIGYQLGNDLYYAMVYNVINQNKLFELLKTPITIKETAYNRYLSLLEHLKRYKPEHKSKTEFF